MKEKAIEEARCEEERCEEARRQKLREGKISPPVGTTEAGVKSDEGKLENDDACFISPKSKDEADAIEAALEMTRLSITWTLQDIRPVTAIWNLYNTMAVFPRPIE